MSFQMHIHFYNRWNTAVSFLSISNCSSWSSNWITARTWPTGTWWSYPILIGHMDTRQAHFSLSAWGTHASSFLLIYDYFADGIKEITKTPKPCCDPQMGGDLCNNEMCHNCTAEKENQSRYVRGTILVMESYKPSNNWSAYGLAQVTVYFFLVAL